MERKHIARGRQLYSSNGKPNDQVFPNGNSMDSMFNEQQLQQLAQLQQLHQIQQNQQFQQERPVFEQKVMLNKDSLASYKFPSAESYHHQKHDDYNKMDYNNNYITNYLKNNSLVTKYYNSSPSSNAQNNNIVNAQAQSSSNYRQNEMSPQPQSQPQRQKQHVQQKPNLNQLVQHQPHQNYSRQQYKYVKEPEQEEENNCKVCDRPDKNLFCKTCSHTWKVS